MFYLKKINKGLMKGKVSSLFLLSILVLQLKWSPCGY